MATWDLSASGGSAASRIFGTLITCIFAQAKSERSSRGQKKNHIESSQAVWGGKKDLLSAGSVTGFFSWDRVSTFTGLLVLFCLTSLLQLVKFCLQVADACVFVACGEGKSV